MGTTTLTRAMRADTRSRPGARGCRGGGSFHPAERPLDRPLPLRVRGVALRRVHRGRPALVLAPALAQLVLVGPKAARESRRVGGAEGRRLRHGGTKYGHV